MIKANELRIGNWVSYESGECQVLDITTEYKPAVTLERPGGGVDHHRLIDVQLINPIPITEEWLLKFGAQLNKNWDCYELDISGDVLAISLQSKEAFVTQASIHDAVGGFPCAYVHQLQNLYFALTGEELTIKENQKS